MKPHEITNLAVPSNGLDYNRATIVPKLVIRISENVLGQQDFLSQPLKRSAFIRLQPSVWSQLDYSTSHRPQNFKLVVHLVVLASWANFRPRDPGHTYVKRAHRWAGSPATGRAGTCTGHPRLPPRRKEKKITKSMTANTLFCFH